MGYIVDGTRGALLTLVAISLPPMLVLVVHGFYSRLGHHPATQGFVRGLMLAVVGIYLIVLGGIMISTGVEPRSIVIMLAALALGATRRVPVIVVLLLAGLAGVILY
jgi:chromate transporter